MKGHLRWLASCWQHRLPQIMNRLGTAARQQRVSRSLLVRELVEAGLRKLSTEPVESPRLPSSL